MDPGLISSGGFLPPHTTVKVYFDTGSGLQQMYYVTTGTQTNWTPGNDPEFGYQYTNFNTALFPFNDAPIYFSYSPSGVGTFTTTSEVPASASRRGRNSNLRIFEIEPS